MSIRFDSGSEDSPAAEATRLARIGLIPFRRVNTHWETLSHLWVQSVNIFAVACFRRTGGSFK